MHVEDSYEGALLRLQRLEQAGLVAPPASAPSESEESLHARMAELEELATLACDDNERLKHELADAFEQIARLQAQVAILEAAAAEPEHALPPEPALRSEYPLSPEHEPEPTLPSAVAPDFDFDSLDPDPSLSLVPRRRGALYLLLAGALGALALALVALHPWQQRRPLAPIVFAPPPPPPPVATAPVATPPSPAPAAQPAIATPPPSAPVATMPAPEARPTHEHASRRHHAARHKHHAARKHHGASHSAGKHFSETSDPLGGLDL